MIPEPSPGPHPGPGGAADAVLGGKVGEVDLAFGVAAAEGTSAMSRRLMSWPQEGVNRSWGLSALPPLRC